MTIDINQKEISVGDKYQVFIDSIPTHKASANLLGSLSEIYLFEDGSDQPVAKIKRRFAFFRAKYDIILSGSPAIEFRTEAFWKGHYRCDHGADRYDIYRHIGRKCSIYRNDRQIAWWDKQAVTWFNGDNYSITADGNCNRNLLIAFCLILDNYRSDDDKKTINIDVGRIGPEAKKFDSNWVPAK